MTTEHWREIFDPAAQIFLNSTVIQTKGKYKILTNKVNYE